MNNYKQLLTLVRFQMAINPFIFIMPLALGTPYLLPFLNSSASHDFHAALGLVTQNQNMWLVGLFGVAWMAPEVMRTGDSHVGLQTGLEFLLTRAVDRRLVLRARTVIFYSLVLALPLAACLSAIESPVLQVTEYDQAAHQEVLERIPGSIAEPKSKTITIPNGNALVQSWRLWLFLCAAIATQVFTYFVYPFKYRKYILWPVFAAVIFLPLVRTITLIHYGGSFSSGETSFFAFAAHQRLCWCGAIVALILGQLWSERRFSRAEQ